MTDSGVSSRDVITSGVRERANHKTAGQVQDTLSFARAERLLGREYHGRFLIELLQNAADAWRVSKRAGACSVKIVLDPEGPALLVANKGALFPAGVVLSSLGQIGKSTKAQGEAIGHKGIGFKSVLEVSGCPELYSGLQGPSDDGVAVRFDPTAALVLIKELSPDWDSLLAGLDEPARDAVNVVPVLRYPLWLEARPAAVQELASEGFDTVIRLQCTDEDPEAWLDHVRSSFADVTDQILLLLGVFSDVTVDDRLKASLEVIEPVVLTEEAVNPGVERHHVTVRRNGATSSTWQLFRSVHGDRDLAGDLAVGVRTASDVQGSPAAVAAVEGGAAAAFHLFFPTHISSGLPFLLHGYFEVDAARTGFYRGSSAHNQAVLSGLADLVRQAVQHLTKNSFVTAASLVELVAASPKPDDALAAAFRSQALGLLDSVAWIPAAPGAGLPTSATPSDVLVSEMDGCDVHLAASFDAAYVHRNTGLRLPDPQLTSAGLRFVAGRQPDEGSTWERLGQLLRPGAAGPWEVGQEPSRFLALLDLLAYLDVTDRTRTDSLLQGLRGDTDSCVIPVVVGDGTLRMLSVPDPARSQAGQLSTLVMARVRSSSAGDLAPPRSLGVAFLPNGLLTDETQVDRARPLGVRPFTVDNVLDRLNSLPPDHDPGEVLSFLWRLLVRERRSEYGTAASSRLALSSFAPGAMFWCQPGRGDGSENDSSRQRRERLLAQVTLPARDGTWLPAETLAMGADWAAWLRETSGHPDRVVEQRATAYELLEAVSPPAQCLLAGPEKVLPYLVHELAAGDPVDQDTTNSSDPAAEPLVPSREQLAFLLRLGVWETLPVRAYEQRVAEQGAAPPWQALRDELAPELIDALWTFAGKEHSKHQISEDFALAWDVSRPQDEVQQRAIAELIAQASALWHRLRGAAAFCLACSDSGGSHRVRYRTEAEDERRPSTLLLQLRSSAWVPAQRQGLPLGPVSPRTAWWADKVPTGSGLVTSPLRHLTVPVQDLVLPVALRSLVGLQDLESADGTRLEELLLSLRVELKTEPDVPRQSFIGLHRLVYDRLAELEDGRDVLARTDILCELADRIVHVPTSEARHDDGRFAPFRRSFARDVPFAVLARPRTAAAKALGILPFEVDVHRIGHDEGADVTHLLRHATTDRTAELLAILVHHSLGAQTLEPSSQEFETRSRRLQNLVIRQVRDLVLQVSVRGTTLLAQTGEGEHQDLLLEGATTQTPVLFHDFQGDGWEDQLRRRLAEPLATLLENPAYKATFALFLQADTDDERDAVLHELGVAATDLEQIRGRLGAVSEEQRLRHQRWFSAVVNHLRPEATWSPDQPDNDPAVLLRQLQEAGLDAAFAGMLVALGGDGYVRRDCNEGSALQILVANGADLTRLNLQLREIGDEGLVVHVHARLLRDWLRVHQRRLAVVLSRHMGAEGAKTAVQELRAPDELAFILNPSLPDVLGPVSHLLGGHDPDALADTPEAELVRLAGVADLEELDRASVALYSPEEQARALRELARAWRDELIFFGTLLRTTERDPRSSMRLEATRVEAMVGPVPPSPDGLLDVLEKTFHGATALADFTRPLLGSSLLSSGPDRALLLDQANSLGLAVAHAAQVQRALAEPRRALAQDLRRRAASLDDAKVTVKVPPNLVRPTPVTRTDSPVKQVATIKVQDSGKRKKQLGDEGEKWVVAHVVSNLLALTPCERTKAVQGFLTLLASFEGASVHKVRSHAEPVLSDELEEDELVEELAQLVHVSQHSDGFGFDVLGWVPDECGGHRAMALEVKSSADGSFHLSPAEWRLAEKFLQAEQGESYAVLVVRRAAGSDTPAKMDLLTNPVWLHKMGLLDREPDGFVIKYREAERG